MFFFGGGVGTCVCGGESVWGVLGGVGVCALYFVGTVNFREYRACTRRYALTRPRHYNICWFLFVQRDMEKKKQTTTTSAWTFLFTSWKDLISTECVFWYACHSVVNWYCDMNKTKSSGTFCCIFPYQPMATGNQHGGCMMTCKIGLIWRLFCTRHIVHFSKVTINEIMRTFLFLLLTAFPRRDVWDVGDLICLVCSVHASQCGGGW